MLKALLLNSSTNVALLVLKLAVAFILTPVIVQALGNHDYGIYEIVISLIGYMGLLEIGLQPAVTRFVARYNAAGEVDKLQKIFSTAISFSLLIGAFIALTLLVWALVADAKGLHPENGNSTKYIYFLLIIACQVLISFPGNIIQCVHQGYQRYGIINLISAINTIIGATVIYLFLTNGYGLIALALGNAIGISAKFIILGWLLRYKHYGGYHFSISYFEWRYLGELLSFGGRSFILGLASSVSNRVSPILIGAFVGPSMVVFYVIPSNLVRHLSNIISSATLNFMPYFSRLHALGDVKKIRSTFLISSRYAVGLSLFGFINVAFIGSAFLSIWIGNDYAELGAIIVYILSIRSIFKNINPFHGRVLTGMDLHGALAKIRVIEAVVYLVVSLALVNFMGITGVALGALIASLVAEPMILKLVCRQINYSVSQYLKVVLFPSVFPVTILITFLWFVLQQFTLDSYSKLLGVIMTGSLIYFVIFIVTVVQKEERRWLVDVLKKYV